MINTNTNIDQLQNLTMGQIAELTKQSKESLDKLKYFKKEIQTENEINAQDLIDSVETKIKGPRFQ